MKIYEKYKITRARLLELVSNSVYGSMMLENQGLPKEEVDKIVADALKRLESKGIKLCID